MIYYCAEILLNSSCIIIEIDIKNNIYIFKNNFIINSVLQKNSGFHTLLRKRGTSLKDKEAHI